MSDAPKRQRPIPQATRTPDAMRVVEAISEGKYDDKIGMIQGALDDRKRLQQEEVLNRVKEVFGDDYVVTKPAENPPPRPRAQPAPASPPPQEFVSAPGPPQQGGSDAIGDIVVEEGTEIESRSPRFDVPPGGGVEAVDLGGE